MEKNQVNVLNCVLLMVCVYIYIYIWIWIDNECVSHGYVYMGVFDIYMEIKLPLSGKSNWKYPQKTSNFRFILVWKALMIRYKLNNYNEICLPMYTCVHVNISMRCIAHPFLYITWTIDFFTIIYSDDICLNKTHLQIHRLIFLIWFNWFEFDQYKLMDINWSLLIIVQSRSCKLTVCYNIIA